MNSAHVSTEPPILYFGTPVVLISTTNPDGTANLAPMSSAFWLGWRCVLGLTAASQTTVNLKRTGECVLNLPSVNEAAAVNRLAKLTGADPMPAFKELLGYRFEPRKFEQACLTPLPSETVAPPRALECPIHLEAVLAEHHRLMRDDDSWGVEFTALEVRIQRVHVRPDLLLEGSPNRIDPDRWRPLVMSFQKLYGLGPEVHPSRLAEIPEEVYRSPDVDRAQRASGGERARAEAGGEMGA